MENLWHPLGGVQISDLEDMRYFFRFFNKMDVERVENRAPWTFNNHLLILHHLRDEEDPMFVLLVFTKFWV